MKDTKKDNEAIQRLKNALDALDMPVTQIARAIGLDRPETLHNALSGKTYLSYDFVLRLANAFPRLNMNYLFGTEDNILRPGDEELDLVMAELKQLMDQLEEKQKKIQELRKAAEKK